MMDSDRCALVRSTPEGTLGRPRGCVPGVVPEPPKSCDPVIFIDWANGAEREEERYVGYSY